MPNVIIHHFTVSVETQHNSNHHLELLFKTYMVYPTVEIMETECVWSPPTFATGCHFALGIAVRIPQTSLLNSRGEED